MTFENFKMPDQQLYDEVFRLLLELGVEVYDYLPGLDASYPFVVLGETQSLPEATMSFSMGETTLSLHVWQNDGDRRGLSELMGKIRYSVSQIDKIDGRPFIFDKHSTSRVLIDTSTDETLLHGVMDLDFKFVQ